jgi:predicted acetyltransferase
MQSGITVVRQASPEDRLPLYRMLELYQHDLSDIWAQELDRHGEYGYALDRFWREKNCHPFVITVDGNYAGFALVDTAVKVGSGGYWMDQFFILKKYRRHGIGRRLARQVFDALPGKWEVGQMLDNLGAQAFWRSMIGGYTQNNYAESTLLGNRWDGVVQSFESKPRG